MTLFNALQASARGTGNSRYVFELAKSLCELSDNVSIVISGEFKDDFPRNAYFPSMKINSATKRTLYEQAILPFKFGEFSLIHYPDYGAPLISSKPTVITLHDLAHFRYPVTFGLAQGAWKRCMTRLSVKRADTIICISEFTKKEAIELLKVPPEKLKVVHSGVRFEKIGNPYPGMKEPYILYVGILQPRKNVLRLIRAFNEIKKQGLSHKLLIVGKKGWLFDDIFNEVKVLNLAKEVIFTGFMPDSYVANLYKCADLFVYPSLYEGFGFPPLEAMACGTPVIVSNVSSLPEVCGSAAYYVNPYNEDDIAKGIYKILTDENYSHELVERGLERVKTFSWEKTANEMLKIYGEVYSSCYG